MIHSIRFCMVTLLLRNCYIYELTMYKLIVVILE